VVPGVDIVFIAFIFAHLNLAWTETADVFTRLGGAAAAKRADELFFFEENATAACNCLLHDLRKLVEQPGQRHFQLNMIIGDINRSCSQLTKGADAKCHPVTRPRLLLHHEHGKTGGGLAQRRFDPAQSLLLAEFVRELDARGSE
jgi:hypothetical protein